MATVLSENGVEQIGAVAGLVWQTLDVEGPTSLAKLTRTIDAPRDMVMQAIGWLAREDKLSIEEGTRGRVVSLV
jgi:hypothetical protein